MNYQKHYDKLILRARIRNLDSRMYVEKHHVVPKCMDDSLSNTDVVKLTAEEHFVAHLFLTKIYPDNNKLIHAAVMMTVKTKNGNRTTNKLYKW